MPRCLPLAPHRPDEDLEHRYRQRRDPVERTHWQMLWLVAQGHTCPAVATLLGYSEEWVRTMVHRDNRDGPTGIIDRRHGNPGQPPCCLPRCGTNWTRRWRRTHRTVASGPAPRWPPG
jgi:hypothetical protein